MSRSTTSDQNHGNAYGLALSPADNHRSEPMLHPEERMLRPTWTLYTCVAIAMLPAFHYGWSNSQVNLSTFNNTETCAARPIVEGTCIMFPGHTKDTWTILVNAWIVGGMCGSFLSGIPSNRFGRKKTLQFNTILMVLGSIIQVVAPDTFWFTAGRYVTGIANGIAMAVVSTYFNEISTPHNRHALGTNTHLAATLGIFGVASTFWYWNTKTGFRMIAGMPIVFAVLFLVTSHFFMVESPVWLVSKGRDKQAEDELARLFGKEHVATAMGWIQSNERRSKLPSVVGEDQSEVQAESTWSILSAAKYRRQLIIAIGVTCANQLSGINAVFLYSSSILKEAGIGDVRYGLMVIDAINVLPVPIAGIVAHWMKKRTMLLYGIFGMILSSIGLTFTLVYDIGWLSIVFVSTYVGCFCMSLGPLLWGIIAELFPDSARGSAVGICVFMKWASNLAIGLSFPYIEDAANNYSFIPFLGTLTLSFVFVYYMVPETSDMTIGEIQNEFRANHKFESVKSQN